MKSKKNKWNPPSWPWELELVTFAFFIIALFAPLYISMMAESGAAGQLTQTAAESGTPMHVEALNTQFGFLWAVAIVALYVMHLAFSFIEMDRVTASPVHLFSPVVFSVLAYYRIAHIPDLENTAFHMIDESVSQVVILACGVGIITSILAGLRKYRYLMEFSDVQWDIIAPAVYDSTYPAMTMQIRPLLYAPRRYRACPEGILIEGWFYACPIAFEDIRGMAALKSTSTTMSGVYYASSARNLIRLELHDSLNSTFISPSDREEFVRYCSRHTALKRTHRQAKATRHDTTHVSDTTHGGVAHQTRADDTSSGTGTRH